MTIMQTSPPASRALTTRPTDRPVLFAPALTRDLPAVLRLAASLTGSRNIGGVMTEALTLALTLEPDLIRDGAPVGHPGDR